MGLYKLMLWLEPLGERRCNTGPTWIMKGFKLLLRSLHWSLEQRKVISIKERKNYLGQIKWWQWTFSAGVVLHSLYGMPLDAIRWIHNLSVCQLCFHSLGFFLKSVPYVLDYEHELWIKCYTGVSMAFVNVYFEVHAYTSLFCPKCFVFCV